jgi:hypothetical protein
MFCLIIEETGKKTTIQPGDVMTIFKEKDVVISFMRNSSRLIFSNNSGKEQDDKMLVGTIGMATILRLVCTLVNLDYDVLLNKEERLTAQFTRR